MKVTTDPLQYCRSPSKGIRGILLYGPNNVLIAEAIDVVRRTILPPPADEMAFVTITPEQFKTNPTIIADEMSSFGFFATKKLLYLKGASDSVVKPLQAALQMPDAGHFIVVDGGELSGKSALRAWGEKESVIASLACYALEGAALQRFVKDRFAEGGARIAPDALTALVNRLGNDVAPLKNLIQQLIDYAGGQNPLITEEHVDALLIDQTEQAIDAAVQAVADGHMPQLDRALHNLASGGTSMVAVLRLLQNYFYRLRGVLADIANGQSPEDSVKRLRPPLFFKTKPSFMRHLRLWNLSKIDRALAEFTALEAACKQTGTPEVELVQQRLILLARHAQRR